jgi:hypothetical protein
MRRKGQTDGRTDRYDETKSLFGILGKRLKCPVRRQSKAVRKYCGMGNKYDIPSAFKVHSNFLITPVKTRNNLNFI